jgi:hypothetical protein
MELLLARDANVEITEAVVTAAAGNTRGKEVMELLLARDPNVEITEAVVTAAAGTRGVAKRSWSCCWPEIPTSRSLRRW